MTELDIDVGNSRIKWRLRQGEIVYGTSAQLHQNGKFTALALPQVKIDRVNIACVALPSIKDALLAAVAAEHHASIFVAKSEAAFLDLRNAYSSPNSLGVDRWLAMIAARGLSSKALCVVSCGTAITLDFVDESGRHEGGYIIPGIHLQRKALHQGTHSVKSNAVDPVMLEPGTSTQECVERGILALLALGLRGIISERMNLRDYQLFFTGGDAAELRALVPLLSTHIPDLVLDGLAIVAKAQN